MRNIPYDEALILERKDILGRLKRAQRGHDIRPIRVPHMTDGDYQVWLSKLKLRLQAIERHPMFNPSYPFDIKLMAERSRTIRTLKRLQTPKFAPSNVERIATLRQRLHEIQQHPMFS